jgi:RNA polymerase sigma-70 factor (ECF subfamily)
MAKETMFSSAAVGLVSAEDGTLVEQACAGDMAAFARLVSRYQDRVLNTCWRMCGRIEDAEDLTQETFLHALEAIGSFRGRSQFYTWLYRIAVNLAISHRRKQARSIKLSLHGHDGQWIGDQAEALIGRVSSEPQDPPGRLSAREIQQRLLQGLDELDDDHRAVVVLRDIEGLDYADIAEILELPVGTVKSRIHRGRMELRRYLQPLAETWRD